MSLIFNYNDYLTSRYNINDYRLKTIFSNSYILSTYFLMKKVNFVLKLKIEFRNQILKIEKKNFAFLKFSFHTFKKVLPLAVNTRYLMTYC